MFSNQVPQQIKNSQNQPNKDSSSSSSGSKIDQSSLYPGNNLRYFPNGNPGGSGSGNTGPEAVEWETKSSCPNPDEIISNINFWNSYLNSKDCCPNIDIEFENQEEWESEDKELIEIPDEVLSNQRRRLLATTPTAKLDKPVKNKYNYSTYDLQPFKFYSKEGKLLTLKNWELEKIVYAHSDDLDLLNFTDKIACPVQFDPNKYQRTECRAITDVAKKDALIRILELTTTASPSYLTRKIPMPSYPSQDALVYIDIDTSTRGCLFFHADNGKLWSAGKLSPLEISAILNNPNFENLN